MNKRRLITCLLFFISLPFYSQVKSVYSSNQLIPFTSPLYDYLIALFNEKSTSTFATNAPLTAGELKFYLNSLDFESLSPDSKKIYRHLEKVLTPDIEEKKNTIKVGGAFFGFDTEISPLLLGKTSRDLDWSFSTDYTGKKNSVESYNILSKEDYRNDTNYKWSEKSSEIENRPEIIYSESSYISSSEFLRNPQSKSIITFPVYLGWGDNFFLYADPGIGKSIWGMSGNYNCNNLVYSGSDLDFLWPRNASGVIGYQGNGWGSNLSLYKSGMERGRSISGSAVYSSAFETEGVFSFNLYSPRIKYNMDIVEVNTNKYLYMHSINVRPYFNWLRMEVVEATFVDGPFEMKFLNPLMIMHSFGSWTDFDYCSKEEEELYGEAHICQYMGFNLDFTPFKNTRFYLLYAQNEIQPPNELGSQNGKSMPDSFALQLGYERTFSWKEGIWTGTLEGIYTTPFCYIKQGADWSLYSERFDMQSNCSSPIRSWIGSPFGPDALGAECKVKYTNLEKFSIASSYLFLAHGTNSFGIFDNTIEIDGQKYYAYYPSVLRKMGLISDEEAEKIARAKTLTGTVQYTNRFSLDFSYIVTNKLSLDSRLIYSFIINNKNESGQLAQGLETFLMLNYSIF